MKIRCQDLRIHRQLISQGVLRVNFCAGGQIHPRQASHLVSATYADPGGRTWATFPLPILPGQLRRAVEYFRKEIERCRQDGAVHKFTTL